MYYIKDSRTRTVLSFKTRKDALRFIRGTMRYEYEADQIYSDAQCRRTYATVQYMGYGIYNYYEGNKTYFTGRIKTVNKDGTIKTE